MDNLKISWFWLSIVILCFSLYVHPSLGADKITANQYLSGDQTIVSAGGVFRLGFFKPGNSSNYYIGIWYNKVSAQTTIWVANRDTPLFDTTAAKLTLSGGNLVLSDESQKPAWSTNLNSTSSSSAEAVLLDSGNLVLRQDTSSEFLWQSFDHPTHTWLPGGKLSWTLGQNSHIILLRGRIVRILHQPSSLWN